MQEGIGEQGLTCCNTGWRFDRRVRDRPRAARSPRRAGTRTGSLHDHVQRRDEVGGGKRKGPKRSEYNGKRFRCQYSASIRRAEHDPERSLRLTSSSSSLPSVASAAAPLVAVAHPPGRAIVAGRDDPLLAHEDRTYPALHAVGPQRGQRGQSLSEPNKRGETVSLAAWGMRRS